MDCRITRLLTLKADGHIVCDDSSGYGIILGEVSTKSNWSIRQVIDGPIYQHVRRSFASGQVPWPGVCENCHTFSPGGIATDTLGTRFKLMVEPTLSCNLGCPSCRRKWEGKNRSGSWDLEPALFEAFLRSCAKHKIEIEEVHYLGWGEPLLYDRLPALTRLVRKHHPHCMQEITTSGSVPLQDHIFEVDIDRLTVSCDGVTQSAYVRYRRGGEIDLVFDLLRNLHRFKQRPFVEWKYILFTYNDSEDHVLRAQDLAKEFGVDSLLFIVTDSKGASERVTWADMARFPRKYDFVTISPAASAMRVKSAGRVLPDRSMLGDQPEASLFLDIAQITSTDVLELRGWTLDKDGAYVDRLDCFAGNKYLGTVTPRDLRKDVARRRPAAQGPQCGFVFKVPVVDGERYEDLRFIAHGKTRLQMFAATVAFG